MEWRRPVIKFNSKVVSAEVVVGPGTSLDLKCEGDGPINWQPRLAKHRRFVSKANGNVRTFKVERPTAEFTGTYRCYYTAMPQQRQLISSVHVYVKGELWEMRDRLFSVRTWWTRFHKLWQSNGVSSSDMLCWFTLTGCVWEIWGNLGWKGYD